MKTTSKKTSDAQTRASRKWEKKNPEQTRIGSYRRTARLFCKTYVNKEDIDELRLLLDERETKYKNKKRGA